MVVLHAEEYSHQVLFYLLVLLLCQHKCSVCECHGLVLLLRDEAKPIFGCISLAFSQVNLSEVPDCWHFGNSVFNPFKLLFLFMSPGPLSIVCHVA